MKTGLVKNIIPRFICWILLLQMINISIDPPDLRQPNKPAVSQKENLSINEIESVYELVSEGMFGNNVPETDDNDIDKGSPTIDLYCYDFTISTHTVFNYPIIHRSYYYSNISFGCPEPNSPPPKYA